MTGKNLSAMVILIVVGLACFSSNAAAANVYIDVDVIYASNEHSGREQSLEYLDPNLPYDSFRLLERQSFRSEFMETSSVDIPEGGTLLIRPESYSGSMIRIKVWIQKATRYKLDMVLQLANGGTVLVAGPSYKNGVILIPISAKIK